MIEVNITRRKVIRNRVGDKHVREGLRGFLWFVGKESAGQWDSLNEEPEMSAKEVFRS